MIGQELRARYEVPQDLPHEMLTILTQLNRPPQRLRNIGANEQRKCARFRSL
jgi:hypothetical protein